MTHFVHCLKGVIFLAIPHIVKFCPEYFTFLNLQDTSGIPSPLSQQMSSVMSNVNLNVSLSVGIVSTEI